MLYTHIIVTIILNSDKFVSRMNSEMLTICTTSIV